MKKRKEGRKEERKRGKSGGMGKGGANYWKRYFDLYKGLVDTNVNPIQIPL